MPSAYAPCPASGGARYNPETLQVRYRDRHIADVLAKAMDDARDFFVDDATLQRPLELLHEIRLGYLRLGQPATELSGGEAQRIKLATVQQRGQRGDSVCVVGELTTGLHPVDVDRLMQQPDRLGAAGNTVVMVEHDMRVAAQCDWVIDMGPGRRCERGADHRQRHARRCGSESVERESGVSCVMDLRDVSSPTT